MKLPCLSVANILHVMMLLAVAAWAIGLGRSRAGGIPVSYGLVCAFSLANSGFGARMQ